MNDNYLENIKTEDELFDLWKSKDPINYNDGKICADINHRENIFVSDGIVNIEYWNNTNCKKILFFLKEAYGKKEDCSLTKPLVTEEPYGSIWKRVVEWSYGISKTSEKEIASYPLDEKDFSANNFWLNSIAVVNVKKSNGKSSTDMDELKAYAAYDKKELKKQIEIINPEIIICGNTGEILNDIFDDKIKKGTKNDNWYYITKLIDEKEIKIIDFVHPANRYPRLLNYYAITNIYQLALKDSR